MGVGKRVASCLLVAVMTIAVAGSGITIIPAGGEYEYEYEYGGQNQSQSQSSNVSLAINNNKEGYPVTWDLEQIYATPDDWQADYDKAWEMLDKYSEFKGKLNNAQSIHDFMEFAYLTELTEIQCRLYTYAHLGESLDPTNAIYKNMNSKISTMNVEESKKNAFAVPEIYEMSLEERQKVFSDPIFDGWEYWVREYTDPESEPLTEDQTMVLAEASIGFGYPSQLYDILNEVEIPYPTITMPNGKEEQLTETLYQQIIGGNYSEDFKYTAYKTRISKNKAYENTFATLLEENCNQAYANSRIADFDTTLEEALDDYELDTDVYYMLVDAAHKGIPEYKRYLRLHKEALGLDVQRPYHLSGLTSYYYPGVTGYDDAVDEVTEALSVLGEEYIALFREIITSGHVDVYPAENKVSGAFETQMGTEYLPWVLFNFYGQPDDVSTIAHEMGHACYDELANRNQPSMYSDPTIFTQEVASTTNELLYYNYMMNKAQNDEERLYYLENALYMFNGTFFTQMMFSEFEDYMYKIVEAGGALDAEALGDKWLELSNEYRGGEVEYPEEYRYYWSEIPHLYYVYYVYQYAADVAYAASIAERISSGEEGAVDDYLEFLKRGGSASPVDLLSTAGIDPLDSETYDYALDYYSGLVDEYERLTKR